MKKLLISGASWTSGWPMEERLGHRDFSWPNLVARHYNWSLVDKSRAGSSNYRIYRKAFDGIICGVDLAIVFWSTWTAFETGATYGDKPGRIYQHRSTDESSRKAFSLFFNGYLHYTDWLRQIISLQNLSTISKIPCYFITNLAGGKYILHKHLTMENFKQILDYNPKIFENMDDQRIAQKFQQVKMLESQIDWSRFIIDQSYQNLDTNFIIEDGHPTEQGHVIIAEKVIEFLDHNLQLQ